VRILYLYCHPLAESFHAALRAEALAKLQAAGHEVDLCDLYAEGFDPVLSADDRRRYHDTARNRLGVEHHAERLMSAEGLVVQFPTWCFGLPAMLKGYFDRLFMPGLAFDMSDPKDVRPLLGNIRKVAAITTYGRPRLTAFMMGDPPRKMMTRYVRWFIARGARVDYLALYHLNVADDRCRADFIARVGAAMARF
jgi:putative NADPH-quinone reductase